MTVVDRVFVDTNILLAATDPGRTEHLVAREIFRTWPLAGVALVASGQVAREYLVVATRPLKHNGLGLTRAAALGNLHAFLGRMRLLDEDARSRARLLELVETCELSGKQIHDANVVATMYAAGVVALLTLNVEDFVRFQPGIRLVPLTTAAPVDPTPAAA